MPALLGVFVVLGIFLAGIIMLISAGFFSVKKYLAILLQLIIVNGVLWYFASSTTNKAFDERMSQYKE